MLRLVVFCALAEVSLGLPQRFSSSERSSLSSESLSLLRLAERNSAESIEEGIRFNPIPAPIQSFGSNVVRTNSRGRRPNNLILSQINSDESFDQNIQFNPVLTPRQEFGSNVFRTSNRGRTPNNLILSQRNSDETFDQNIQFNPVLTSRQEVGSNVVRTSNRGRTPNNLILSQRNSDESFDQNIQFNPVLSPRQEVGSTAGRTTNRNRRPNNYRSIIPTPRPSPGCPAGQIRDYVGTCVFPDIIRDLYVFAEPDDSESEEDISTLNLPKPTIKYNLVVIRADEEEDDDDPIVIPPPQEKTLVLVLKKEDEDGPRQVIEIPAGPDQRPEVFFIKYDKEDNTQLPGGITLQEALEHSISAGQRVSDVKSYGQH